MLASLSIRNIVLIESLDIEFSPGLCVFSGETGAGKSILLDAIGLAAGRRADSALVRAGCQRGEVSALFEIADLARHPAGEILREQDIGIEEGEALILRRVLGADGKSRAYVNGQPVSVSVLRQIADCLLEVTGQHDAAGLLREAGHLDMLDDYGALRPLRLKLREAYRNWQDAAAELDQAKAALEKDRAEEDYLRHALAELEDLAPEEGEEERLARQRQTLMNAEKIIAALNEALQALGGDNGVGGALRIAQRALEKAARMDDERFSPLLDGLDRAIVEIDESLAAIEAAGREIDADGHTLDRVEERLFALRALGRKHQCAVDDLPALQQRIGERLAALEHGIEDLIRLQENLKQAQAAYDRLAGELSAARQKAAGDLAAAVQKELPPLRLEKAAFRVELQPCDPSPSGRERACFQVRTNPGAGFAPLARIASGGELSRFLLALKVVLSRPGETATLIFDEVDAGIGGATAMAVGERLRRLAERFQVMVVTHSPQVAAQADRHFSIRKTGEEQVLSHVDCLDDAGRLEEVARMLAGNAITDEARAAAAALMKTG